MTFYNAAQCNWPVEKLRWPEPLKLTRKNWEILLKNTWKPLKTWFKYPGSFLKHHWNTRKMFLKLPIQILELPWNTLEIPFKLSGNILDISFLNKPKLSRNNLETLKNIFLSGHVINHTANVAKHTAKLNVVPTFALIWKDGIQKSLHGDKLVQFLAIGTRYLGEISCRMKKKKTEKVDDWQTLSYFWLLVLSIIKLWAICLKCLLPNS